MYAVISDGSHQYRVEEGTMFRVQVKPEQEADSKALVFDRVLLVGDVDGGPRVGQPAVPGASVSTTVLREVKGDKVIIRKFKRRKKYALKKGHRQRYLEVKVDRIDLG